MISKDKKKKKTSTKTEKAYMTKRLVVRVASSAVKNASRRAMEVAGYVIKAENGWIVRENIDGSKSRISKITKINHPKEIALD